MEDYPDKGMEDTYDVIIVGGGPAGLTAAQYSARSKLKTLIIDKSPLSGALAYTSRIENYPGVIAIPGVELLDILRKQAVGFGAEYIERQVIGVDLKGDPKITFTVSAKHKSRTVIIATGSMGRAAAIEGEEKFLGKGVSYCASCDAPFFGEKVTAIIGSSPEALEEADAVSRYASKVYIITSQKELPASKKGHPIIRNEKVEIFAQTSLKSIYGDDVVRGIKVIDDSGIERDINVDGVFIYLHGTKPITDFLGDSLNRTSSGCIEVDREMQTSIEGVYAAGDVTCKRVRQAIISASEGFIAALSAERYIYRKKGMKFDWRH